jgi:hypothetical protein
MAKTNWEKIKTEYISSTISYRDLAAKYKVSRGDVSERGSREGWVELRRQHRQNVVANACQKAADIEAKRLAKVGQLAYKALDVAMEAFEDEKQFNRYIVTEGRGLGESETVERQFTKVDTRALKDLTTVIKDLASVIRNVYGLPTQAEAESQRIAAERLKLERRKVDEGGDRGTDGIDVSLEGAGPEEWNE